MAQTLKATPQQVAALKQLATLKSTDKETYKVARAAVYEGIRATFGIPTTMALSVVTEGGDRHGVIKARPRGTKQDYVDLLAGLDGRWADAPKVVAATVFTINTDEAVGLLRDQAATLSSFRQATSDEADLLDDDETVAVFGDRVVFTA